jgi:MoxR-like ATPase
MEDVMSLLLGSLERVMDKGGTIEVVGPTCSGKLRDVCSLAEAQGREWFLVNCDSSMDKGDLVGRFVLSKKEICFQTSPFLQGLETPNSVVVLSEYDLLDRLLYQEVILPLVNEGALVIEELGVSVEKNATNTLVLIRTEISAAMASARKVRVLPFFQKFPR